MVRRAQRRIRVVAEYLGEVGVGAAVLDAGRHRQDVLGDEDVVEFLRIPVEHERIALVGRGEVDQIRQIRIHEIGARECHEIGRRRGPLDGSNRIDVTVVDLECVVVADRDDPLVRVRCLTRLNEVREEFRLRLPLVPDPVAVGRVVDAGQRTQVVHDDGDGDRTRTGLRRKRRAQDERRSIVQQRLRWVSVRTSKNERRIFAFLSDVDDGNARRFDEEARVDATDVVAFCQIGLVIRIRIAVRDGVFIHLVSNRLQHARVLDLLEADDVGRQHHVADLERRLVQPVVECRFRQHGIAGAGIVRRVEEALEVRRGDRELVRSRHPSGNRRREQAAHRRLRARVDVDRVSPEAEVERSREVLDNGAGGDVENRTAKRS